MRSTRGQTIDVNALASASGGSSAEGIDSGQLETTHGLLQLRTNEELLHGWVLPLLLTAKQLLAAGAPLALLLLLLLLGLHFVHFLGGIVQGQTSHVKQIIRSIETHSCKSKLRDGRNEGVPRSDGNVGRRIEEA